MSRFFILLGQSNMVGRGDPLLHLGCVCSKIGCQLFRRGEWVEARHPLQDPDDPVFSTNADRLGGIGPGLSFGRAIGANDVCSIGLLLCAKGGTGIGAWGREGILYTTMRERLRAASLASTLAGALIYIGESDTHSIEAAEAWKVSFEALVSDLRTDSGEPDLPIVFAQLSTITPERRAKRIHGYVGWDWLKEVQRTVTTPRVAMVATDDLHLEPDGLHLSAHSADILGKRFAAKMCGLLNNNRPDR